MKFIWRSRYISLPVGVLLSGCSHLGNGRIAETNCIHNFDSRQEDGSVWEEKLTKSSNGWARKTAKGLNTTQSHGHAVSNVDNATFRAVDYPQAVMSPRWVKFNPHPLEAEVLQTGPSPKVLLVVLGQGVQANSHSTMGFIYYKIMKSDNTWGTWHSQSDQNLNASPAKQVLVTTPLNVQSR